MYKVSANLKNLFGSFIHSSSSFMRTGQGGLGRFRIGTLTPLILSFLAFFFLQQLLSFFLLIFLLFLSFFHYFLSFFSFSFVFFFFISFVLFFLSLFFSFLFLFLFLFYPHLSFFFVSEFPLLLIWDHFTNKYHIIFVYKEILCKIVPL